MKEGSLQAIRVLAAAVGLAGLFALEAWFIPKPKAAPMEWSTPREYYATEADWRKAQADLSKFNRSATE